MIGILVLLILIDSGLLFLFGFEATFLLPIIPLRPLVTFYIFQFEIRQTSVRPYVSEVYQTRRSDGMINLLLPQPLLIVGDIKIEFIQKLKLDILNLGQR